MDFLAQMQALPKIMKKVTQSLFERLEIFICVIKYKNTVKYKRKNKLTADRLAQLVEHRTAVREIAGSNLGQTNTQGL